MISRKKTANDEYLTISLSKKSIALIIFLIIFGSTLFLALQRLSPISTNPRVEKVALMLQRVPFIGALVPVRYLPTDYVLEQVKQKDGYQTKIVLGDIVLKMVQAGVIDRKKMEELYKNRGGIPKEMEELLTKPSSTPIRATEENSKWLINLLWAIGLSNRMEINEKSPIAGVNVGNYASTGGWNLGKEENGGDYFNALDLITLTPEQEKRVKALGETIYRPCCDNSSFFQDCNHGSAALALIELGVAQGLSDAEIYHTVLAFNVFWFPQNYAETAIYFQKAKNQEWKRIDPKLLLSKTYSSISEWMANVDTPLKKMPDILPALQKAGSCSA